MVNCVPCVICHMLKKSISALAVAWDSAEYESLSLCCSTNVNHSTLQIIGMKSRLISHLFFSFWGSLCKLVYTRSVNDLWISTRPNFAVSNSGWWFSISKWPSRMVLMASPVNCGSLGVLCPDQHHKKHRYLNNAYFGYIVIIHTDIKQLPYCPTVPPVHRKVPHSLPVATKPTPIIFCSHLNLTPLVDFSETK